MISIYHKQFSVPLSLTMSDSTLPSTTSVSSLLAGLSLHVVPATLSVVKYFNDADNLRTIAFWNGVVTNIDSISSVADNPISALAHSLGGGFFNVMTASLVTFFIPTRFIPLFNYTYGISTLVCGTKTLYRSFRSRQYGRRVPLEQEGQVEGYVDY